MNHDPQHLAMKSAPERRIFSRILNCALMLLASALIANAIEINAQHENHGTNSATQEGHANDRPETNGLQNPIPIGAEVRLEELEEMALRNNPTLAQAEASVAASSGRSRQAGLFPNPVIGYEGDEFAFRAFSDKSEHSFFVEQTIPLGGKLSKTRRIFQLEGARAETRNAAQRQRVLNTVRALYYDALGAQRLVELRIDLARLARAAVGTTAELFNVGQADRPDQLEIEIEAERAEIDALRAQTDWEQTWRALAAAIGQPEMRFARLAGNLEEEIPLDESQLVATLLNESPEIKDAQTGVERARAVLTRARAERVPDLFLRGNIGYSTELLETPGIANNRRTGPQAGVQIGVTLPLFNRQGGRIAAAQAELAIAEREVERLRLTLRTRLAASLRAYRNAKISAERYRTRIVPRAREAYQMYLTSFRQMAAAYPQVLIAQRTLFHVEVEYARALAELRRSTVGLRGFLLSGGLDAAWSESTTGGETRSFAVGSNDGNADDSDANQ